jgi:hypothetical protein
MAPHASLRGSARPFAAAACYDCLLCSRPSLLPTPHFVVSLTVLSGSRDLHCADIDVDGADVAAPVLASPIALHRVRLRYCYQTVPAVLGALAARHAASLRHLDVSNMLSESVAADVAPLLRALPRLVSLDASPTRRAEAAGGGDALFSQLRHCPALRGLNVSGNMLCVLRDDLDALAAALRDLPGLRVLRLTGNGVPCAGVASLEAAAPRVPRMTHLFLSCNEIDDAGIAALARCVPHWPRLRTFDTSYNLYGDDGACCLAVALTGHTQLTSLDVSGNRFRAAGAGAMRRCVEALPRLKFLDAADGMFSATVFDGCCTSAAVNV